MDENKFDSLVVSDPDAMSEEYNKIYEIYCSMGSGARAADEVGPVDDLASILSITNDDTKVAMYHAWDIFNIRGRQRRSSGSYGVQNYFEDSSERKARQLLVDALDRYIRHLEPLRYGYNKIATLFSFMISRGLYGMLSDIYIPEMIRPTVNEMISTISNDLDDMLTEIADYFHNYNNEKLDQVIKSLGRIVVSQRSDQIIENLKSFEPSISDEDRDFLQEKRDQFLDFSNGPKLSIAKSMFNLSDGSYYRNLDQIVGDLTEVLDEDSIELLTDLFIRS